MPLIVLEPPADAVPPDVEALVDELAASLLRARRARHGHERMVQEMTASVVRRTDLRLEEADQDGGHDPRP